MADALLQIKDLEAWAQDRKVLDRVNMAVEDKKVLSIIGPRGSGKSSLLRCMNRLFEDRVGHRVSGQVLFHGQDIYSPKQDLQELRRRFSMVFSEATLFSHLTIFENVALGLRLSGEESGAVIGEAVEKALNRVGLWTKLRKKLHHGVESLTPGEKQFLCIARAIILKPDLLILDEVTNHIGLHNTYLMEQFIREFSERIPIVLTTSSRKQAARISDRTAFLLDGELIEVGKTSDLFMNPKDERTEDFLTGRFG